MLNEVFVLFNSQHVAKRLKIISSGHEVKSFILSNFNSCSL